MATTAIDDTAQYLRSLYEGQSFPRFYGEKQLDQLCTISASFGHNQTPLDLMKSVPESPRLLSLWMLIGWAIDNVFDKHHALTTNADVAALVKILDLDPSEVPLEAHDDDSGTQEKEEKVSPLVASLLESTHVLYNQAYVPGVKPYADRNPEAWQMLKTWYSRYVAHVRDRQAFESVDAFMRFRLADVGIMCQYAQVMMFKGAVPVPQDEAIWSQATLAIAAVNDIVSFPRDMAQGTPNMLGVHMRETGATEWETIKWADETAYELETNVDTMGAVAVDPYVAEVASFSVANARLWHLTHPRYAKGVQLLMARRNGNATDFETLLHDHEAGVAQADPCSNDNCFSHHVI